MPRFLTILLCAALLGCGDDDDDGVTIDAGADGGGGGDAATSNARTIQNCATSVAAGVPAFYRTYFRCVTITTATGGGVTIETMSLPPHLSYYYGVGHTNYAPFDTSRGAMYQPNPNQIVSRTVRVTIPAAPVAKGIPITAGLVDGVASNNSDEYPLGAAGVALDSVPLFNPLAAPGMNIENEKYTFDDFNAHPAPDGTYHYHTASKGPLEILAPSSVELYGIMCDGTLVLGCTELDGSAPAAGLDAQGGHVGDVSDGTTVHFAGRYHVHVCPSSATGRRFTPEIQYYTTCTR